CQHYYTSPYSF
nr:immunoglobulin light chain junction region [Macaca mulatta]MPN90904.1 immunoglobulin light chain junction region [Macaca mulatta]MPN91101.1 immunoglobulin light chain junction region [Macaca mulatta]MPN91200.1 immunoglobulin light chain junction region [Macaca mulatta]MPN91213.1 immunoglobulin light chain junction region [Macaca mulatta]